MENDKSAPAKITRKEVILNAWLGLPNTVEPQSANEIAADQLSEETKMEKNLQALKISVPENNPDMQYILNRSWLKIEERLSKRTFFDRIKEFFANLNKPLVLIPAFSAAAALIVVLQLQQKPNHLELTAQGQKVDITQKGFETSGDTLVTAQLENVSFSMRNIKALRGQLKNQQIELTLNSGSLLVSYAKTKDRAGLHIVTPHATYQVVGTRFLIESTSSGDRLFVQEGTVGVTAKDVQLKVKADQWWSTEKSSLQLAGKESVSHAITKFMGLPQKANVNEKGKATKGQLSTITLYLTNGQILQGNLISDSTKGVEIEIPTLKKTVLVQKDSIEKMIRH